MSKNLFSLVLIFFFFVLLLGEESGDFKHKKGEYINKKSKIITHGEIMIEKGSSYINIWRFEKTDIEEGDTVTVVPEDKKLEIFKMKVRNLSEQKACGLEDGKDVLEIESRTISNEKISTKESKNNILSEDKKFHTAYIMYPHSESVKRLDSTNLSLPKEKENLDVIIDRYGDGEAKIVSFRYCCSRRCKGKNNDIEKNALNHIH